MIKYRLLIEHRLVELFQYYPVVDIGNARQYPFHGSLIID